MPCVIGKAKAAYEIIPLKKREVMNYKMALLDVAQMAAADRLAAAAGSSVYELMANAGTAVADAILARWASRPVLVLCGPGNNGGNGFVVAQRLAEAGWTVRIGMLGSLHTLKGAAKSHAKCWQGQIEAIDPTLLEGSELVVDALFGAGLTGALDGAALEILVAADRFKKPIVAIDVPSGVMGDTGEVMGAVRATLTVTFFRKKPGHLLQPARRLCGELVVADIGTPLDVLDEIQPDTYENDPCLWLSDLPRLLDDASKHTRGHALVFGGYPMTGASRMAARAAARSGAGLTTIAVPEVALPIYSGSLTSIMVRPVVTPEDFMHLLNRSLFSAWLIGPGVGADKDTLGRTLAMLGTGCPTVLDADAITVFQDDPDALDRAIVGPCVLTPHDGEFKRVFDPAGDKLTRTRAAARRSGAVIVLKGSDTVIAAPDGRAIINTNAPATLATAGSGDVLSGIILGLMAQGMSAFLAAAAGVWIHGAAANHFGPGLLAEDLPELLPRVLQQLATEASR